MKNLKTIVTGIAFGLAANSYAQWNPTNAQTALTGSQLSQQYSASTARQSQPGNLQTLSYLQNDHQEVNDVFNRDQSYKGLKFTNSNEISSSSSLYFSSEVSRNEQHVGSVFSTGNWLFGASVGQGENFVKTNNTFTGIDPYFIHGGSAVKFNYYGANAGYQLNNGSTMYFGSSNVQAERLEDRQANYLGYQSKHLSAAIMDFQRGGQSIGKGVEFATKIKSIDFGYRQLSRDNGAHSKTLSFTHPTSIVRAGKFGFAVESTNNPLNREEDNLAFMFTFSGEWGKPQQLFNLDETEEETKSAGINKMAVIGAAVVGGALIASSGSSSKDNEELIVVEGQDNAAFQVLNRINPVSVRESREYGGFIYRNPNGSYGSTEPKRGQFKSINLGDVTIPNGTRRTASYHTHGDNNPQYDNENFSPADIRADNAANIDGYLGTPGGSMKHHDVETGRIRTVRRIAN